MPESTEINTLSRPLSEQPMPPQAEAVFTGKIFTVHQWDQFLYDGTTARFEKLSRNDSVGILAITEDKKIIVTKQEQPSMNPFYSLLGGVIDPGEVPIETAHRELLEEAGATTPDLRLWFSTQPITKIDWAIYMFIAKHVKLSGAQQLDAGEKIELLFFTFEEFLSLIVKEDFRDFEVSLRVLRMLQQGQKDQLAALLFGNE